MSGVAIELREWETVEPEADSLLAGLSLEDAPAAQALADALTRSGRLSVLELARGLELSATSYVGRLNLGPLTITIRPKIEGAPLLNLLRYAYGLRDLQLYKPVAYAAAPLAFQDLLVHQLAAEVSEILARGLHREYERRTGMLASPRGRPDFQAYVRGGGMATAALPCVYHPRVTNTLLNRVLRSGLRMATASTEDLELRARLRRLAQAMDLDDEPLQLNGTVLGEAWRSLDRRTAAYSPTLTLLELLLEGQGIAFEEHGTPVRLSGMLFDMNRFFQELLSRFLHEHLTEYTVRDEYRLRDLFSYDPAHNPRRRRSPTPRPDFMVLDRGKVVAVLDAKYRDLWERSLPRGMLYQLALYALSQSDCRRSVILYPTLDSAATEQRIRVHDPLYGAGRAEVVLRPVDLLRMERLLTAPDTHTWVKERKAWARELALR
jgi:5-methylcytosine-specific restriction enzyme subunit McrC